jgi:hypothetical protein
VAQRLHYKLPRAASTLLNILQGEQNMMSTESLSATGPIAGQDPPDFSFSFIDENGVGYTRSVYWERLYVFSPGNKKLLVAVRVVPHESLDFATYLALRQQNQAPVHHQLLAKMGGETQPGMNLVESFSEVVPHQSPNLPMEVAQTVDGMLDAVMNQAMTAYGMPAASHHLGVSTATAPLPSEKYEVSTGGLGGLSDLTGEDVGWLHLSNMAYRVVQEQADTLRLG